MEPEKLEQEIDRLAALGEPVRRALYFYVVRQRREVGRDEAAQAVGISRTLAGFHLDRLAQEGLLATSFRRLSGRTGPGAGRPAKLYRQTGGELAVTLPQRAYGLAAQILAETIDGGGGPKLRDTLKTTARAIGRGIGTNARARAGARPGKGRLLAGAVVELAAHGYEPERRPREILLRNCPFHALVSEHADLVCGMNHALMEGVVEGLEVDGVQPVFDPKPGLCCVGLKLGARRRSNRSRPGA